MKRMQGLITSVLLMSMAASVNAAPKGATIAKSHEAMTIDGYASEAVWSTQPWQAINHIILGDTPLSERDFSGRFKLAWKEEGLYLLVEISDDVLFDQHANPLLRYWDDDCLEVFVDADASGGDHQFNFNAFAYHVGLDGQVADIGEQTETHQEPFILLNDHVNNRWRRDEHGLLTWELMVFVFDDDFKPDSNHPPMVLSQGHELGFMLAYCDNDGSDEREHFIGSVAIKPINGDKNLGYKNADVFQRYRLNKE
ncbi:sugar-binding protein [Paraferrimonas haliotis]|uniref:Carbohydrate-binding domain-containing protein n=1 Tax=Paraferrimonas haliotis TaxID=2013866 RepID=A0AA37TV94_9GAMM|nr:sugar-binding protein [Paraferrimonas haliotis]GLS83514.1 hypothetical protein GCM10007894_14910 [Paraferrimonas haliotis]